MHANSVGEVFGVVVPLNKGEKLLSFPLHEHQVPDFLQTEQVEAGFVSPNLISSELFFAQVLDFPVPNHVNCFVLGSVKVFVTRKFPSPNSPSFGKTLRSTELVGKLDILVEILNRFEGVRVPLLQRNAHFVLSEFIEHSHKRFECVMALFVKPAVCKELVY